MLNKKWIDNWMGRNDVILRNEAYAELVEALRAQADAQPMSLYQCLSSGGNWVDVSKEFWESATGTKRRILPDAPAPEAAQALSDEDVNRLARKYLGPKTAEAQPENIVLFARAILTRASAATSSEASK